MDRSTREKALRHLVSAMLSGVFSNREIKEIADMLINRDSFAVEAGHALREIVSQFARKSDLGFETHLPALQADIPPPVYDALSIVKEARISQRELINIIADIEVTIALNLDGKRLTTIAILERCFREMKRKDFDLFLSKLLKYAGPKLSHSDSYLDLITKKLD